MALVGKDFLTGQTLLPEPDLFEVVRFHDRRLGQAKDHVRLAPEHLSLLDRRGVEHDGAEGVHEPDQ